ncbi:hypothetical protein CPB85DRAFT_382364 [Mucidula mucida]|nr:hypothetical protein CPB85DRAFT_382364 [Mucidula mucida]
MCALILMFLLSTFIFALDVFWFFYQTRGILLEALGDEGKITPAEKSVILREEQQALSVGQFTTWLLVMLLGDSLVMWRSWELSASNVVARRLFVLPVASVMAYLGTLALSIRCIANLNLSENIFVADGCRKTMTNWALSLATYLTSTCIIWCIGWCHRVSMRALLARTEASTSEKIIRLLSESGFVYFSVNSTILLVMSLTPDSYGAQYIMAMVFNDIAWHLSTVTPILTLVLVRSYGSLWDASTGHMGPTHTPTAIHFISNPAFNNNIEIYSSMNRLESLRGRSIIGDKDTSAQDGTPPTLMNDQENCMPGI